MSGRKEKAGLCVWEPTFVWSLCRFLRRHATRRSALQSEKRERKREMAATGLVLIGVPGGILQISKADSSAETPDSNRAEEAHVHAR